MSTARRWIEAFRLSTISEPTISEPILSWERMKRIAAPALAQSSAMTRSNSFGAR